MESFYVIYNFFVSDDEVIMNPLANLIQHCAKVKIILQLLINLQLFIKFIIHL